jgi:hypothetical protein
LSTIFVSFLELKPTWGDIPGTSLPTIALCEAKTVLILIAVILSFGSRSSDRNRSKVFFVSNLADWNGGLAIFDAPDSGRKRYYISIFSPINIFQPFHMHSQTYQPDLYRRRLYNPLDQFRSQRSYKYVNECVNQFLYFTDIKHKLYVHVLTIQFVQDLAYCYNN